MHSRLQIGDKTQPETSNCRLQLLALPSWCIEIGRIGGSLQDLQWEEITLNVPVVIQQHSELVKLAIKKVC